MRAAIAWTSWVAILLLGAAVSPVANAAPAVPGMTSGRQLPMRVRAPAPMDQVLQTASPDYVATDDPQQDEYEPMPVNVHRVADGSIVTSFDNPNMDSHYEPRVVDDSLVAYVRIGNWSTGHDQLQVRDIETGSLTWSQDVPADQVTVGAAPSWLLTRGSDGIHLFTPWGAAVLGITSDSSVTLAGSDDHLAVLRDFQDLWAVDTTTAAVTHVTTAGAPDAIDMNGHVVLGPTRLFWVNTVTPPTGPRSRVFSVPRSDLSSESVFVDTSGSSDNRGWLAFGNGIAILRIVRSGFFDVDPVDLTTGSMEGPVLTKVLDVRMLGDGGLGATLADTATGRVVVIHDDGSGPRTVFRLPPRGYAAVAVTISGQNVAADYSSNSYAPDPSSETDTFFHPAFGSGGWSQALTPGEAPVRGAFMQFDGDVTATQLSVVTASRLSMDARLTWPGGFRDLSTYGSRLVLGRGGQYVAIGLGTSQFDGWRIEQSRTGQPVEDIPPYPSVAIDHQWLWTGPDASGALTGTDLSGRGDPRRAATGIGTCANPSLHVAGRWALVECRNNSELAVTDAHVVDLTSRTAPWTVPNQPASSRAQLGDGFVAWSGFVQASDGSKVEALHVTDLGPGHVTRLYGPLHGAYTPPDPSFGVNDDNSPTLVYLDERQQARVVTLDWLSSASTRTPTDTTPPVISGRSGTPLVDRTPRVAMRWTATDPGTGASGSSFDVRYKLASSGSATYTGWRYPSKWQQLRRPSISMSVPVGAEVCFEVRAVDRAGNLGEFSRDRCNSVALDDRALMASHGVTRVKSRKAMGATLSRLDRRHAVLARHHVAGRWIAVRIRRGPHQGAAKVYIDHRRIGVVHFQAAHWGFRVVRLPTHGAVGKVRIKSVSSSPALVDALAVLR